MWGGTCVGKQECYFLPEVKNGTFFNKRQGEKKRREGKEPRKEKVFL